MRRGILGGTFDPPHIGHLAAGEAAYHQLGLEVVTFIPAGAPWQKAESVVTAAPHRWEMIRLAVESIDYFQPDDREVKRDGWTYTIDTLEEFPEDDLFLILGADAAAGIESWHRAADVLAAVTVAVAPRPGTPSEAVALAAEWLDMPPLAVSSTELRVRARAGSSIRFFVPEPAHRYLTEHSLYAP